jgi:5'-3' exonuclease
MTSTSTIFDQYFVNDQTPTFIFVDGSYYCFHRYFSILRWQKNAHPEEANADPFQNPIFVEKFRKTFVENIQSIPKNLGLHKENTEPILFVGKDCPRENIWRNALQENYKGNRKNGPEDGFMGGPFFKMAYQDELFHKGGAKAVLTHPHLEADDCIAISVKHLLQKYENVRIFIVTSDKDYLQLVEPRVQIFDLAFKNIGQQKSSNGDAKSDLFCKIVMGDTSDNIPSVLKKCGPKTALKCYEDRAYFEERMKKEDAFKKFEVNQKMVDFNFIPGELVAEFIESISFTA